MNAWLHEIKISENIWWKCNAYIESVPLRCIEPVADLTIKKNKIASQLHLATYRHLRPHFFWHIHCKSWIWIYIMSFTVDLSFGKNSIQQVSRFTVVNKCNVLIQIEWFDWWQGERGQGGANSCSEKFESCICLNQLSFDYLYDIYAFPLLMIKHELKSKQSYGWGGGELTMHTLSIFRSVQFDMFSIDLSFSEPPHTFKSIQSITF